MGHQVDPDALRQLAAGINATIDELEAIGFIGEAATGNGFDDLALSPMQVGHAGLEQAFGEFCERWGWGVRNMVHDANAIAQRLDLAAGMYHDMEQYAIDTLKQLTLDVAGNPHESHENAGDMSWGEIGGQVAEDWQPDNSAASWQETAEHSRDVWERVGEEWSSGPVSSLRERLEPGG